jgi:hypothetical protein
VTDAAKRTYVVGCVWWCGDYVCDCTQAVIERVTEYGGPFRVERVDRKLLWEGQFHSGDDDPLPGDPPSRTAGEELDAARTALRDVATEITWRV